MNKCFSFFIIFPLIFFSLVQATLDNNGQGANIDIHNHLRFGDSSRLPRLNTLPRLWYAMFFGMSW